jgi:hypothetical protein
LAVANSVAAATRNMQADDATHFFHVDWFSEGSPPALAMP